ncbi:MAG: carboxypeptidase regulatory-like domain-containing protein [Bryobacteraceae bacterium]
MASKLSLLILLVPALLSAAAVEGIVKDPSGAAIPGAGVILKNSETALSENALTDNQGHFAFADVAPGKYTITIQHDGFEDSEKSIDVADAPVTLALTLKIAAQQTAVEVGGKRSAFANSDPNYVALRNANPGASFRVANLIIQRDNAKFTFTAGQFNFLPPVLGRVAGGVFTGEGTFHLTPAIPFERSYLRQISGGETVEESFRSVVFWFTDDTFDEIKRQAQATDDASQAGGAWHEFRNRARRRTETPRSMLEFMLQDEDIPNHEAEMLGELYNRNEAGSFRAFIHGNKHSDLRFFINPRGAMSYMPSPEEVALVNFDPGGTEDGIWYLTHFAAEWKAGTARSTENRHTVAAEHYRIETAIGKNDHLSATCVVQLKAKLAGVRVVGFGLLPRLRVTRVTYKDKEISFVQESRKEDGSFYAIMPEGMAEGQSYSIGIEYEGDKVVEKEGSGNFSVGARTSWYPSLNTFADRATYDLTFKVPKQYTLIGVGKLEKEWKEDEYAASHWVSDVPMAVAGFNYGLFKKKSVYDEKSHYQIEAYATSEVPDFLRHHNVNLMPTNPYDRRQQSQEQNLSPSAMAESTMIDAQNAIRLFQVWFGDAPYGRIAITQQPAFNFGQSWPTLVYLPVSAFLDSTQRWMLMGGNAFRFADFIQEVTPHEVSHQWWGHMVGWASYHDQWLSEGFADFSAGLFLQQTDPKPDKFLKYWERAQETIMAKNSFGFRPNDAGPLWTGIRLNTFKTGNAYSRLIYPKGGFALHMLRYLMYDRDTGDKDFIAMMHDFVATYMNQNASTESFKSIVEKHIKPSLDLERNGKMDWFFRQWVYGTEVPSYRMEYSLAPEPDGKFLFTAKVTQSGVSSKFVMGVPIYFDFDGHVVRAGEVALLGNMTSNEVKVRLPKKPKRVLLNANHDVLAAEIVVKAM